ncbi:MAG: radical SAM protein [Elusimicrobiota bacterium]|jgi:radical SAM superfamily enzyme YgiQ (UPF0313 family)|nr:radical SAM protein [Elusimicrobiota bacterium]
MKILLINPPIYDFAAYDLWAKPLGLLYLSAILKAQEQEVELLDYMNCRDALHLSNSRFGCGHYQKIEIPKPPALKDIPRRYCRYGISKKAAQKFLQNIKQPDLIIMTSIMTYWYPGVFEAIETAQEIFPKTKIILGGVYATLCGEHFLKNGNSNDFSQEMQKNLNNNTNRDTLLSLSFCATCVSKTCATCDKPSLFLIQGSLSNLNQVFKEFGIAAQIPISFSNYPAPDFSFYPNTGYAVLRLSLGCPFDCSYCAQKILCDGRFERKSPALVFKEIESFVKRGIENIVFYDDALLYQADIGIKPLLKKIIEAGLKIKIHTPNGLHIKYLDLELAYLMKKTGFCLPRFSLETANPNLQKKTGGKIDNKGFEAAAKMLNEAGFGRGEFIIYLLMGIPNQKLEDVEQSIRYVRRLGGRVSLSEYSIIPQTKNFANTDKKFIDEPLYHNKSVYPLFESKDWDEIYRIKLLAKKLNAEL